MPRARIPNEAHRARGTFRADRHGCEVQADGEPKCPKYIRGAAREYWNDVVPGLVERGLAKECDAAALASLCRWQAILVKIGNSVERMDTTDKRYHQRIVQLGIATDKVRILSQAFGLDPQARSKLPGVEKPVAKVMSRARISLGTL